MQALLLLVLVTLLFLLPRPAHADILMPFLWSVSATAVVLLPVIVLVEAFALSRLSRLRLLRALWLSAVVNGATTLVGVLLSFVAVFDPVLDLLTIVIFFFSTVWLEAMLLQRLASGIGSSWRLSLKLNLFSYVILFFGSCYFVNREFQDKQDAYTRAQRGVPIPYPAAEPVASE